MHTHLYLCLFLFLVCSALFLNCLSATLYTDKNALFGTIPSELGSLANLTSLDIDTNMLEGSIPTEFGNLKKLVELDLDKNKLNGTIPTEFGLLIDLRELDISKSESSKVERPVLLLN